MGKIFQYLVFRSGGEPMRTKKLNKKGKEGWRLKAVDKNEDVYMEREVE